MDEDCVYKINRIELVKKKNLIGMTNRFDFLEFDSINKVIN